MMLADFNVSILLKNKKNKNSSFIEIQFTYHTIHPFKVYNSKDFGIQLTLEQDRFELLESTYMQISFQ